MTLKTSCAALFAVLALFAASPASAGTKDDIRDLQERIQRAEQALSAQSAATVKINELERQIQLLTGRIEEMSFQLDQQNRRIDSISAALAGDTLGAVDLGAGFGAPSSAAGPVDLTTGDPIAEQLTRGDAAGAGVSGVELPLDPNAAYDYASGFLLSGDYERAKAAFELYIEAFPNHARTPDAKFRLGEIYLALGENANAADVFLDHIRSYPNDPRAAESYLKLGTAFSRLEKPKEACSVLKTMKAKFPNAAAPIRQRADLEMARIDCQ